MGTAECWCRRLGIWKTYGSGGSPALPGPPEPQDFETQAVSVPSFFAPTSISAKAEGRSPATVSSAWRSSISLTGAPAILASWAQTIPQRSTLNLLPKPPPTKSAITRTLAAGMPSPSANCEATPETACVEHQAVRWSGSVQWQIWPWASMQLWATAGIE